VTWPRRSAPDLLYEQGNAFAAFQRVVSRGTASRIIRGGFESDDSGEFTCAEFGSGCASHDSTGTVVVAVIECFLSDPGGTLAYELTILDGAAGAASGLAPPVYSNARYMLFVVTPHDSGGDTTRTDAGVPG
jgi:hypothetical protein